MLGNWALQFGAARLAAGTTCAQRCWHRCVAGAAHRHPRCYPFDMPIELDRTFGEYTEPHEEGDENLWLEYFGIGRGRLTWADIHKRRVSVVLGEAGIGKTVEFELETSRLAASGSAFFVALNQLQTSQDWETALGDALERYERWRSSAEVGYFQLDSVDEARLQSPTDLVRALSIVREALKSNLGRVRIAISSRVTDWTVAGVQEAVRKYLLNPINLAVAHQGTPRVIVQSDRDYEETEAEGKEDASADTELMVVTLDALSIEEAKRCAGYFGLKDEAGFWEAVNEGEFEFMASRPLDLGWMVKLWNRDGALGTYLELMKTNVASRLEEDNDHYRQIGKVLSIEQRMAGAEELAAAAEFGGLAFLCLQPSAVPETGVLDSFATLPSWKTPDTQLLLSTAVFDEASLNRVRFHHRSIREYLAATWLNRQMGNGVPLARVQPLFASTQNGVPTVIPSRRAVLAWLASLNVHARAWVVRWCPELVLEDGDPESWGQLSVDEAFAGVIAKLDASSGFMKGRGVGAYQRVGRALSPGLVSAILCDDSASWRVRSTALNLARDGKIRDCVEPALAIYADTGQQEYMRSAALDIVAAAGTAQHRARVLAELLSGAIVGNHLIADALVVSGTQQLTADQLAAIFDRTDKEAEFSSGPMASVVTRKILPKIDVDGAVALLTAVLASLPKPGKGKPFSRYPREDVPERAWLFNVLLECFERLVKLTSELTGPLPAVCFQAAAEIESLRQTDFLSSSDLINVRKVIEGVPSLRMQIALAIAQSSDLAVNKGRLVWDYDAIVRFSEDELPELIQLAGDASLPADERAVWFDVAAELALRTRSGRKRSGALREMRRFASPVQVASVTADFTQWRTARHVRLRSEQRDRDRKTKYKADRAKFVERMAPRFPAIAEGTDFNGLRNLLNLSFEKKGWSDSGEVDVQFVASHYGQAAADAFCSGLGKYWRSWSPIPPSARSHGEIPWESLVALAGVSVYAARGGTFADLTDDEAASAARTAAWALPAPPRWFEKLHASRPTVVEEALQPWVLDEAITVAPISGVRGALALALASPSSTRRRLLNGVGALVMQGKVVNASYRRQLVVALLEDGLFSAAELDQVCQTALDGAGDRPNRIEDLSWMRLWAASSPAQAWTWFRAHLDALGIDATVQLSEYASSMGDLKWLQIPPDEQSVALLLDIAAVLHRLGSTHVPENDQGNSFFGPPTRRMLEAIGLALLQVRGSAGRDALLSLIAGEPDPEQQWQLRGLLTSHAEQDAAEGSAWSIERLRSLHRAFDSAPQTEAQLYDQVLARLEDIRESVELGPFSERSLFHTGMPEKHLQLWLAAKFQDTQNLRYSVHREEVVDADNRTDIQLACQASKVCVEIKPLDRSRSYSANTLVQDTLKRQIVGQYLRGKNSSRGILVLLQLDDKRWELDGNLLATFDELVKHLQKQAELIKSGLHAVNELKVFGIRCAA